MTLSPATRHAATARSPVRQCSVLGSDSSTSRNQQYVLLTTRTTCFDVRLTSMSTPRLMLESRCMDTSSTPPRQSYATLAQNSDS
jgi:hypothetical protein